VTEPASGAVPSPAPRRARWWMVLLIASLALNVATLAAIGARSFVNQRIERLVGPSYAQLVPRRFLADISKQRRDELRQILNSYRATFRDGREGLRAAAADLANVLETAPSDEAAITAKIDGFAEAGSAILADGAKVAKDMVAKLTPDERKLLGQRIRERAGTKRK
jgi:uncharacterized membrane protein